MLFIENDKKYSTPVWIRVFALARRYSSSELLKQMALSFVGTSCRMITTQTTVSVV